MSDRESFTGDLPALGAVVLAFIAPLLGECVAAEIRVTARVVDERQREITELRAGASDRHQACVDAMKTQELRERCLELADKALNRESNR